MGRRNTQTQYLRTQEPHKDRVREVRPAWQVAVARAAEGVGRVRQARQRTLEVEEKDAVPFRVEAGETGLCLRA